MPSVHLHHRLIETSVPRHPQAAVLVLHGGGSRGEQVAVSPAQLSVLRMIPIAGELARAGRGRLAVFRVLNSVRGWDASHTPVHDVREALRGLRERLGRDLPTGLVGHSLGGRAALLAGGASQVRSVVALAPWLYRSDVNPRLRGRKVLIVHGSQDRVAKPENAAAVAQGLRRYTDVRYVEIAGGKHAMLSHRGAFERPAIEFVCATLLGDPVDDGISA